jgi:predicted GIY-YIG superfamily endonuclease
VYLSVTFSFIPWCFVYLSVTTQKHQGIKENVTKRYTKHQGIKENVTERYTKHQGIKENVWCFVYLSVTFSFIS